MTDHVNEFQHSVGVEQVLALQRIADALEKIYQSISVISPLLHVMLNRGDNDWRQEELDKHREQFLVFFTGSIHPEECKK